MDLSKAIYRLDCRRRVVEETEEFRYVLVGRELHRTLSNAEEAANKRVLKRVWKLFDALDTGKGVMVGVLHDKVKKVKEIHLPVYKRPLPPKPDR